MRPPSHSAFAAASSRAYSALAAAFIASRARAAARRAWAPGLPFRASRPAG